MKTISILMISILIISGCSSGNPPLDTINKMKINTMCIDGVTYFVFKESYLHQGYGYMSPKFKRDGSLKLCDIQ